MDFYKQPSEETMGAALVLVAALAFSTAGIFTKAVAADAWSVIFWRGAAAIAFVLFYLAVRGALREEARAFRWPAVFATLFLALGTAAFISAFKLTSVANVSVIWATAPFMAACLAFVSMGEHPGARVLVCSAGALLGVLITIRGSWGAGSWLGDVLAVVMTAMMAAAIVIYRAYPDTPTKLPAAVSAALLLPVAVAVSAPLRTAPFEIFLLALFGLVFAAATVLLMEGASRISPAKAALLSALETPLAPLWALLILAEWPTLSTVCGGAVIIGAVVTAQWQGALPLGLARPHLNDRMLRDMGGEPAATPPEDTHETRLLRGRL